MNNINLSMFLLAIGLTINPLFIQASIRLLNQFDDLDEEFIAKEAEKLQKRDFSLRMMCGLMFSLVGYKIGWTPELIIYLTFTTVLIIGHYTDSIALIVPDKLLIIGTVIILITRIFLRDMLFSYLLSALILFTLLYLVYVLTGGKFGGADVKMFGLIGLTYGWNEGVMILYLGCILGIGYGLWKKWGEKGVGKEFPFYPCITFAVMIRMIFQMFS